jgi:predicted Zn-dependent peptidase
LHGPTRTLQPLQQVGATDMNGTTWFDRTNYFETVPTGALDRTLMLESDRMGYLLGAVTQEKLDNQRAVVQNEKRQGDNQPFGLVEYEQLENLYPTGHPYHHSTIGSMADLNSATLNDVRGWAKGTLPTYQDRKAFFEEVVNGEPDPIGLLRDGYASAVLDLIEAAKAVHAPA